MKSAHLVMYFWRESRSVLHDMLDVKQEMDTTSRLPLHLLNCATRDHARSHVRLGPPPVLRKGSGRAQRGVNRPACGVLHGPSVLPREQTGSPSSRPQTPRKVAGRSRASRYPNCHADADSANGRRLGRHRRNHPGMCMCAIVLRHT